MTKLPFLLCLFLFSLSACGEEPHTWETLPLSSVDRAHTMDLTSTTALEVITRDSGGSQAVYQKFVGELAATKKTVVVEQECASGCTYVLILGPEQVCTYPLATFMFHGPSVYVGEKPVAGRSPRISSNDMQPLPPEQHRAMVQKQLPYVPKELHDWYLKNASHRWGPDFSYVKGSELIRTGLVSQCNGTPP